MIQQEQRERHVASHGRDEQRRAAGKVRVSARADSSTRSPGGAGAPRCGTRPCSGAPRALSPAAFRIGLRSDVHVDAGAQQRPSRLHVSHPRGKVQRGKSRFGVRLKIRIRLDQRLQHLRMLFARRPTSTRFDSAFGSLAFTSAPRTSSMRTASALPAPRARHQRRLARSDRRVGVCAGFQKQINERGASVRARLRERRHPKIVRRVGIGAGADQQLRRLEIVPMRGPQERRRAVLGSNIHVRTPAQQRTHLLQVLIFRGVDEPEILVCGGCADNHEQRH